MGTEGLAGGAVGEARRRGFGLSASAAPAGVTRGSDRIGLRRRAWRLERNFCVKSWTVS